MLSSGKELKYLPLQIKDQTARSVQSNLDPHKKRIMFHLADYIPAKGSLCVYSNIRSCANIKRARFTKHS